LTHDPDLENGDPSPRSRGVDHQLRRQNALVVHPVRPNRRTEEARAATRLEEAVGLALALDLNVAAREIVVLREISPPTLFGRGKVETLGAI
jgi:GTP-binding protein HflX